MPAPRNAQERADYHVLAHAAEKWEQLRIDTMMAEERFDRRLAEIEAAAAEAMSQDTTQALLR